MLNQTANNDHLGAKSFIKNMFSFSLATWVGAAISFIATPIITRVFITEEMGKINLFFTYAALLEYIALFAMNQGYMRFHRDYQARGEQEKLFRTCLAVSISSTCLVSIIVFLFWEKVSLLIIGTAGILIPSCLCLYLLTRVFMTMSNCAYRMDMKVIMFSVQAIIINIAQKISYIFAGLSVPDAKTAIIYLTVCNLGVFITFFFIQRKFIFCGGFGLLGAVETKEIIKYSAPMIPALLLSYLNTSMPSLLLNKYIDFSAVGVYGAAVTLVQIITLIQTGFNVFWTPYVYKNYDSNKNQIQTVHKIIAFIMPVVGICILILLDVIYLFLGPSYRASKPYFGFMLISPILYTIAETTGLGINVYKKTYINIFVTSITVISNFILCIILIPRYGSTGAAIAVCCSSWAMYISKTFWGEKLYSVVTNWKYTYGGPIIFLVSAIINIALNGENLIRIISLCCCGIALIILYRDQVSYLIKVFISFFHKE